jgi:hypothetical protein
VKGAGSKDQGMHHLQKQNKQEQNNQRTLATADTSA